MGESIERFVDITGQKQRAVSNLFRTIGCQVQAGVDGPRIGFRATPKGVFSTLDDFVQGLFSFGLEKLGPKQENKAAGRKGKVSTLLCCSYQKGSIVVRSEFDASKKPACLPC